MPDNPGIRGDEDRQRINVNQEHEVRYWSQKLGVTPDQLREAIQEVGPMTAAVEQHIHGRNAKGDWREKSVG